MEKQGITPEVLVDLPVPSGVCLSPDGLKVVYSVSPAAKKDEHEKSSIWIADVGKEHSARQLTSGHFHDEAPQWCPNKEDGSNCIAFISDRAKLGESSAIYLLDLRGGEPYPITKAENKKKVAPFEWSPNGHSIAFTSSDEKSAEQTAKDEETGDVKVYGENWEHDRLRIVHVATREVRTLSDGKAHVSEYTWNSESNEIVYITQKTPEMNSPGYDGVTFERVYVATEKMENIGKERFPGPAQDLVWIGNRLFFLAGCSPDKSATSLAIYSMRIETGEWCNLDFCGISDCAVAIRKVGTMLYVHLQRGLSDEVHVYCPDRSRNDRHSVYAIDQVIDAWDAVPVEGNREVVLTLATSSVDAPTEIFAQKGTFGSLMAHLESTSLSQYGKSIPKLPIGDAQAIYCNGKDGVGCDGILVRPKDFEKLPPSPLVVLVRGGPYTRLTKHFNMLYFYWGPWLVAAGYAVLFPNYRGGSSHGEKYASSARGGLGTDDYDDVIALTRKAIQDPTIDADKVAIGGYSQGGFMSYLAVTRQEFYFKAAICGAGVTDVSYTAFCPVSAKRSTDAISKAQNHAMSNLR